MLFASGLCSWLDFLNRSRYQASFLVEAMKMAEVKFEDHQTPHVLRKKLKYRKFLCAPKLYSQPMKKEPLQPGSKYITYLHTSGPH